MTRKRFVKLIMARGISRNEANELAGRVVDACVSYKDAYKAYTTSLPKVFDTIRTAVEAIQRVANAICIGMSAFAEAFSSALNRV
ncbi:Uncharacterised protein [uncultured Flavonifractor sp.]|nr:Uncharacterised protein [uncultured Flavonifractor sp.]